MIRLMGVIRRDIFDMDRVGKTLELTGLNIRAFELQFVRICTYGMGFLWCEEDKHLQ